MRPHNRVSVLFIGHALAATGFARVLHSLLPFLSESYEVHHFGTNFCGEPPQCGWTIHANPLPIDIYGRARLPHLMETIRPKLVLVLDDIWKIPVYLDMLGPYRAEAKVVAYCPVDARMREPSPLRWVPKVDRFVVYTTFARQVVERGLATLIARTSGPAIPRIDVIPHGTDTGVFYPYPARDVARPTWQHRMVARRILFSDPPIANDAFIALNASRNQPRKRIDITIEGFARFAAGKPRNVYLYLHMSMKEIGCDVIAMARNAGIADRLLVTSMSETHPAVSDDRLNLIYNACDVGINTASGEGWGLASFEHGATGSAQIVPRHSGCAELWENSGIFLEPRRFEPMGRFLEASIVSGDDLASALERLYLDREYLSMMSAVAYSNATQPGYRWEVIAQQWSDLFEQILTPV